MSEYTPGDWEAVAPKKVGKHWSIYARGKLGGHGSTAGLSCLWHLASIGNGAPGDSLETEAANARLMAASKQMLQALKRARQFIINGVECGYVRMPEPGDTALDTLPAIEAALAKAEGRQ